MKDLIAKLQMDANCALGAIWLHIEAREKRIAELESEVTRLSASWRGDATVADALEEHIAELEAQIAAAPVPVVEEKDLWALLPNSAWYLDPPDGGNVSLLEQLQRMSKDAAAYRSTALQAPVREVPGYKMVPLEVTDAMLEAWKHELCIPVGSSPEAKARRAYRAMLAAAPLPADPVQEPKP